MEEDTAPPLSICGSCGEELASAVTLTVTDRVSHLLPDDPVFVDHPDAPGPMHKRCAMKWVDEQGKAEIQVAFPLAPNSLRQGGVMVYFPPDATVELVVDEDRDSFKLALENESERGCVLVATAFLDHVLEEILGKHFPNKTAGNKLVKGFNSPLGTFSSRITAAFALGLIVESEHKQLEVVRRIRNQFAHEFSNVGFSDPAVKNLIQALPEHPIVISSAENPTRQRFENAVEVLLTNLRYRVDEWSKREVPSATLPWFYPIDDSGVLKISEKVELGVELRDPWVMSLADRSKKR